MSKIICEICGTSYPDTSEQCPICGYTRDLNVLLSRDDIEAASAPAPVPAQPRTGSAPARTRRSEPGNSAAHASARKAEPAEEAHTKGGRFSQANVRKRNESAAPSRKRGAEPEEYERPRKKESNGFLVVVLLIVIVALLSLTAYIGVKYFLPYVNGEPQSTIPQDTEPSETQATDPVEIPCTSIVLVSGASVKLEQIGQNWLLNVLVLPIDTTDTLTFTSSDESVATVDTTGTVTAVGTGEAVITISCGSQSMECKIQCTAQTDEPQASQEATDGQ